MIEAKKLHNYKIMQTLYTVTLNVIEPSVFVYAVDKRKNQNIKDYSFACGSVWL
jgi:hypothetical protein